MMVKRNAPGLAAGTAMGWLLTPSSPLKDSLSAGAARLIIVSFLMSLSTADLLSSMTGRWLLFSYRGMSRSTA